jgi:putative transposase
MDCSEFETARGGIWRICAVIDYATNVLPRRHRPRRLGPGCARLPPPGRCRAERVLDLDDLDDSTTRRLDDLGADRGVMDVVDADDYLIGEAPAPIAVVTDNGPCLVA